MPWLFPAVLSTLIGCTLLSVAYGYLYYAYRKKFLALWFLAWTVHALRYIFLLIIIANGNSPALSFANLSMIVISLYFLYAGTSEFIEKKVSPLWQGAFVLVLAWTALAVFSGYPFLMLIIPLFGFFACVDIWVGYSFLRSDFSTGIGKKVVGITFIVWGLHQADYPFLRPVEWFAPFGYMIGTTCTIIIALGMLILFFEKIRSQLDFQKTRLRQMFDSASYGIALADPVTGIVIDCNTVFAEMLEKDMSEIIGKKQKDFHPIEEHKEDFTHTFKQHLQEKSGETLVSKLVTSSGKIIDVEIKATLVDLENKKFLQGFFTDISEKRQMELELENLQHLYRETEKVGKVGGWEIDITSFKVKWTEEVYHIHGVDSRIFQPTLETAITFYTPSSRTILEKAVQRAIEYDEPYDLELEIRTAQGNLKWVHTIGNVDRDQHKVVGFLQDITERKIAEDALLESEITFRKLFEGSSDPILLIDGSGVFVECNQAALDLLKMTREQFLLLPPTRISPEFQPDGRRSDEAVEEMIASAYSKGRHRFDWTCVNAGGNEFIVEVSLVPILIKGQSMLHTTWRDITQRKLAEEEKLKLELQLHQAQKMESIGTLAGGIAHDFNNILGAILGYAEMAQEDSPAGSILRQDIDQIVKASHRAKELVKQILAFSRQAETECIPLQPASIIEEAIKMLRASLPSTIDIRQNIDMDAGFIQANPTQIHQVVMNLGSNAYHAMEDTGGTLTISLLKKTLNERDIVDKPGVQPGDFVQLSVGDTGPGIAPEHWDKIFDPYFTTKEVGKGTGMGLAIIHGIVKSYGGWVSFQSHPGKGTVFQVLLPVIAEGVLVTSTPEETAQIGNERILFIDDEELLAEMGKSMLERLGYRVTVLSSSPEALRIFQNQPDMFDLIITDQTMPGMTGIDMARRMLQIRPGMPIILCTGYSSLISEDKARLLGIKGFAMKPLTKKSMAVLIRKVLDVSNGGVME